MTDEAKVEALIQQLGSEDWGTREKATNELIAMGDPVIASLKKVTTNDPEVKNRISYIIAGIAKENKYKYWKTIIESHPDITEVIISLRYDDSDQNNVLIKIKLSDVQKDIPDWESLLKEIQCIFNICKDKKLNIPFVLDYLYGMPKQSIVNLWDVCRRVGITNIAIVDNGK